MRFPSTMHEAMVSGSTQWAPAAISTGLTAGKAVHFRPLTESAAAKINCPWQIEATGFLEVTNFSTKSVTDLFMARYSGARPPGKTKPSYLLTSISSNVALRAKL